MKKRVLSILLVAAMTASLAACGGSDSSNNSASGSGEITLTIPTFCVGENVGAVYFEPAVERFNEANKGKYHIELEEVVEASYTDKISQLAQSDSLPTLIQTPDIEWIKTAMIPGKLYYPMNDFLDEHPEIKELCVDSSLEYCTLENGDIISVPAVTLSNTGLYYNSALYSPEKTVSSMTKNYVYYEARTLHDSSLSKAIHSITACDLGMEKEAYEMFMSAALTDLGQEMKSSDAGIHSANMGGVWQDVVMGFGGIRIRDGHLRIAPNCPKQWEKFTYPIYWKGNKLDVTVCKDGVEVINEGTAFMAEIMGQMVTVEKGKNEFLA